jgi:hypothetical protein
MHSKTIFLCLSAYVASSSILAENLTQFPDEGLAGWNYEIIDNETQYEFTHYKQRAALKATSNDAASGYILEKKIDLFATPYLSWSWLAKNKLPAFNERSKKGDDYVARIYVVIDGGLLLWQTKSLSYVWSSNEDQNQVWDNAYTGSNVQMIAIKGRDAKLDTWYDEKQNVYRDLIKYFGDKGSERANEKAYRFIDMIAIMTDTDNSGASARAYYGDILFSSE